MKLETKSPEGAKRLSFLFEDNDYVTGTQFLFGREIKKVVNIPLDADLYMQNAEPWEDNLIGNDEEVDLARPGVEYFFVGKDFEIRINGVGYHWHQRYITGAQVLKLAQLKSDIELLLKTADSRIDDVIQADEKVDLLQPGVEEFYTDMVEKGITIIVSGVAKSWDKKKITFKEVIVLAYGVYNNNPNMVYTVAYEDGPKQNPEGSMVKDSEVFTRDKMIFHATATDKS